MSKRRGKGSTHAAPQKPEREVFKKAQKIRSALVPELVTENDSQALKRKRKHLDERLRLLAERTAIIEKELILLESKYYRVCIFGSARIKPESKEYQEAFTLARYLAWSGIDVLTGGGPGLMEAANKGAKLGREEKKSKSLSFGLSIQLTFEPIPNSHLDIKRHHQKFSSRLDDFMRLSNAIVVTPGGIGTLLELFFTWQLVQVKHIESRPIVLMDCGFWGGLDKWMRDQPLKKGLISPGDFGCLSVVDTPEQVFDIISSHHKEFLKKKDALSSGKRSK